MSHEDRARSPWSTRPLDIPAEIETPALVVDLDIYERNLDEMASICAAAGVDLFPHTKTHRTVELAMMQLAHGASGLTAATVTELEAFVAGGAERVLMAFPLVGDSKVLRVAAAAEQAEVAAAIDSVEGARAIGALFAGLGRSLDLYLIIDSGLHRVGVEPEDAVAIGKEIDGIEGVNLTGVMTHEGSVYGADDDDDLVARARAVAELMVGTADALRAAGVSIETVSLGASASARTVAGCAGVTQIRPGMYAFNDLSQVGLGLVDPSRCAARVAATVISHPAADRACIDAGSKTLSRDPAPGRKPQELFPGYGAIVGHAGWRIANLSEEHGWLRWVGEGEPTPLSVGQRVQIIPNHVCTVFSSAGQSIGLRDGEVVDVWPVIPRGADPFALPVADS
ncbi:MAG TPA: alanine racemase [Solirubrobacterales bacterium]